MLGGTFEETETQNRGVHHEEVDFEVAAKTNKKLKVALYDFGRGHPAMGDSEFPVSGGVQGEIDDV